MPFISRRRRRSRAQWQALIVRAEQSVAEFCRRESLSAASFYTWRNRLRALAEPVSRRGGPRPLPGSVKDRERVSEKM